jgi:hypothetical protein
MTLDKLPEELLLQIFSYLSVQSLVVVERLNHLVYLLIKEHVNLLYLSAACLHSFVKATDYLDLSLETGLEKVSGTGVTKWLEDCKSWKDVCASPVVLDPYSI